MVKSRGMQHKFREWLRRYLLAETLGTTLALIFATVTYVHTHSYLVATGAGFVGEGIGFYGYLVVLELVTNGKAYRQLSIFRRLAAIVSKSSTNLIIEFAPAEIIDNIFIRPFLMFYMPQHIHPYALGFFVGKELADVLFYAFAIGGYEVKQRLNAKSRRPA